MNTDLLFLIIITVTLFGVGVAMVYYRLKLDKPFYLSGGYKTLDIIIGFLIMGITLWFAYLIPQMKP